MSYKDKYDSRYRAARMRWYYKNKEMHRSTSLEIIQKKKVCINQLKSQPCMDCGKLYPPYVMDFDHREKKDKKYNIGLIYRQGWKRIKEEINKCDIVCANCHRIRTYKNLAH